MATLKKEEGKNFPTDIYIFGKGIFTGDDLPIAENAENVISIMTGAAKKTAEVGTATVKAAGSSSAILGFISENWKLLSVGAVALVVLIKD